MNKNRDERPSDRREPLPLSENRDHLQTEDDRQRDILGPRGVPGAADPARMTPQQKKNTPDDVDDGHTA